LKGPKKSLPAQLPTLLSAIFHNWQKTKNSSPISWRFLSRPMPSIWLKNSLLNTPIHAIFLPACKQHKLSADRGCSHYDFSKPCNPLKSSSETISKGSGYSLSVPPGGSTNYPPTFVALTIQKAIALTLVFTLL